MKNTTKSRIIKMEILKDAIALIKAHHDTKKAKRETVKAKRA